MRSLARTANVAAGLVIAQFATALLLVVAARRSAVTDFGGFSSLYFLTITLGALLDFGSSQRVTRDLAQGSGATTFISWLQLRSLITLGGTLLFTGAVAILGWSGLSTLTIVALASQAFSLPLSMGALAAVRSLRSQALASWLTAGGNVAGIAVLGAGIGHSAIEAAALGSAASWVITTFAAVGVVYRQVIPHRERYRGNPWCGSFSFGITSASLALQQTNVTVIAWAAGDSAAGVAGGVSRWTQPMLLLSNSFALYMFPQLAAASSDREALDQVRAGWIIPAVTIVMSGSVFLAADHLVRIVLGSGYSDAAGVLRVLAVAAAFAAIAQPTATFLQARGHERKVASASVAARVAGLVLVWPLASAIGALAGSVVALATAALLAVVFLIQTLRVARASTTTLGEGPQR